MRGRKRKDKKGKLKLKGKIIAKETKANARRLHSREIPAYWKG
jgi:hypothetical protein